jgi:hypothetical protein
MDIDKILGHPLADKSAVGAINRPLRSDWGISLMCIIAPMSSQRQPVLIKPSLRI